MKVAVSVRAPEIAPKAVFLAVVAERTEGRRNCRLKREDEERRGAANTMLKDLDVVDYFEAVCSYENCERNVSTVIGRSGGAVRLYANFQ